MRRLEDQMLLSIRKSRTASLTHTRFQTKNTAVKKVTALGATIVLVKKKTKVRVN